jgi:hypothetical protein
MKIKDLKKLLENFSDEDTVAIEINEELHDCIAYDDDYARNELETPTLVIGLEYVESNGELELKILEKFKEDKIGYTADVTGMYYHTQEDKARGETIIERLEREFGDKNLNE